MKNSSQIPYRNSLRDIGGSGWPLSAPLQVVAAGRFIVAAPRFLFAPAHPFCVAATFVAMPASSATMVCSTAGHGTSAHKLPKKTNSGKLKIQAGSPV